MDGDRAVALPGTEGAQQPAWKVAGSVVSFFAAGKLKQLSLADGVVRNLADAPAAAGATWLSDGSLIFASGTEGWLKRLRNGVVTAATELRADDRGHMFPVSFGDEGFIYIVMRNDGRRAVRMIANGQERDLTTTSGHAQLVGEFLVHVNDGTLLAQRVDAKNMKLVGRATALGVSVGVSVAGRAFMTASRRLLLFASSASRARELTWFDADGRKTGTTGDPGDYWQVRLAPDDRHVAATMLDPLLRALDVFVVPSEGSSVRERLTLALAADSDPVWSPDGLKVLFRSFQNGQADLFTKRIGVADAQDETLLRSDLDETPTDWSPLPQPGGQVLYTAPSSGANSDIWMLDGGAGSQTAVAKTGFNESDARWSPDHQWLSFVSDESGQPDIYAAHWPNGGRIRISFAGGTRPRWARDGSLLFLRGQQIMRSERLGKSDTPFAPAREVLVAAGVRDFDAAHRSDRIIVLVPVDVKERANVHVLVDWRSSLPGGR